jgi:hypothetical protein
VKRFLNLFVLTQPEQRLIVILILLLVAGAWFKHHRDLQNTVLPAPTPRASATPQGAATSTPLTN